MLNTQMEVIENITWKINREQKPKQESKYLKVMLQELDEENKSKKRDKMLCLPEPKSNTQENIIVSRTIEKNSSVAKHRFSDCVEFIGSYVRKSNAGDRLRSLLSRMSPKLIIGTMHIFLNFIFIASISYILFSMLLFVKKDVIFKIGVSEENAKALMTEAKRLYEINKCDIATRVPAMEGKCGEWDHMMRNGMNSIKYTKIVVEMCAEAMDGFFAKISIRSIVCVCVLMVLFLIFRRK
ncbi:hypothetical protein ENBRE01_3350 [Enteropsectra breve]|nr:hypothetical protein ENBRE01_3350 [Enteropsectra breve]